MTAQTVIVDYNSGNLHSAEKAFRRMAQELSAGEILLSSQPEEIASADRVVLPGVGAFADCRCQLKHSGLEDAIFYSVLERRVPFFGICVGMQMMATLGLEHGKTDGFGWIPGEVVALERQGDEYKIPHMGWNDLTKPSDHPVLNGIHSGTHVYFVHSYHFVPKNPKCLVATTTYGTEVAAVVANENQFGTQFHPEKSQKAGLRIIGNFLSWNPN